MSLYCNVTQGSQDWHKLRNRITASRLGFLLYSKTDADLVKSARQMLNIDKVEFTEEQTRNMKVGVEYEDNVRQYYSKKIGQDIKTVGIYISKKYPFLAGSPDGILENGDIIEIKISSKDVPEVFTSDYDEIYQPYVYQMMLNCYLTGAKRSHFVFYSRESGKVYTRIITFDKEKFKKLILIPCINFYNNYMLPIMEERNIPCVYSTFNELLLKYDK